MPEFFSSALSFLWLALGFSLVIFVHELGHFMAAKWAGVRVEQFAIGFGKELAGFTRGETRYSLNVLPLGGYVKMLGQEDFVVDKSGELKVKDDPRSFTNKTVGQRMVIISAGVIMNLIFATIAFTIVVMVGRYQPPAVVGSVVQNMPAARAGLEPGDRITRINGQEIQSWSDLTSSIVLSDLDEPLELDVYRDGRLLEPKPRMLPEFKTSESVRQLGIGPAQNRRVAIPSIFPKDPPGPHDLHKNDELYKLVLSSGEAKEFKDLGVFYRAMTEARGAPVEAIVKRPKHPDDLPEEAYLSADSNVESDEVRVTLRALWVPVSNEPGDTVSGSLLGLVPRLMVWIVPENKTFEKSGATLGDVIARIGSNAYPSNATLVHTIEENPGREVNLEVSRPFESNNGLSGLAVSLCSMHREELIAAAHKSIAALVESATQLSKNAGLSDGDRDKLVKELSALADGVAARRWLENVDVHKLKPLVPKRPFSLVGKAAPPPIDAVLHCNDEEHLVVADILDQENGRRTPAAAAGIPVGAVILTANGKPVDQWWQLCEQFRTNAGKTVDVTYRVADEVRSAKIAVPETIAASLNLDAGTRITKIDGKTSTEIKAGEKLQEVSLPDFRAIRAILESAVGKTVEVEYVSIQGKEGHGKFAVTAENTDPWLQRVMYIPSFICQPLVERHQVTNPIAAAGMGFHQAYQATMQTVKSIEHMLFTRQMGMDKVSGPVGIFRIGTKVAESGWLNLLFFLAVISANLAVLNFLPMPIVDGGLFLFLILEKIRGEPVSIKTQVATQIIGIALIATVFILVTYQDIKNWILGA
ncbi:MAG TPA: site-2 protease family protein [Phycisphaerae bacterium]|nr:site-2 protease family protein [Phycisphaerae bacterium]